MSDTLTDDHHDWATSFCGIDTRGSPAADESTGSGVTVLPEVTIVGDPASADTGDQSATNVTTIPEVTVEGSAALAVSDPLAAPAGWAYGRRGCRAGGRTRLQTPDRVTLRLIEPFANERDLGKT
jgi:hypothetical protein